MGPTESADDDRKGNRLSIDWDRLSKRLEGDDERKSLYRRIPRAPESEP